MASQSAVVVVQELKKILSSSEEGLDVEVQRKVEQFIAELDGRMPPPLEPIDPAAQEIEDGFNFFKRNMFDTNPDFFQELARGQHPKFLVFACSDSRVNPPTILNLNLGRAFYGRNIANMVPPFDQLRHTEIGSVIEYAVKALQVENILIIGHSHCGGIERLMKLPQDDTFDFIDEWVKIGMPAKLKVLKEANHLPFEQQLRLCEKESVNNSMENLMTYPFVRDAVENGKIIVRGGYYDFVKGTFCQWRMRGPVEPPRPPMPTPCPPMPPFP